MLKKTVTYETFDGEMITEDLYFNMTRMDLVELNSRYGSNDLATHIETIQENKDIKGLYQVLKDIVLIAYGVKSEDGKRFIRNDEVRKEFEESLAFAQLVEDFHESENAMSDFVTGITRHIKGLSTEQGDK